MTLRRTRTAHPVSTRNKAVATRYIEAFNHDDWAAVTEVVAPGFVFHHPMGGTVVAGPDGMAAVWAGFKRLSPDSWHPIPIMIAEADHVAVLLPTYGHFTGSSESAPPPTGGRLDYGMVNMVRLEDGMLVETWFGMDPLVEMQQMGVAPAAPRRQTSAAERARLDTFAATVGTDPDAIDTVTAFDNIVVAIGPPQHRRSTASRRVAIHRVVDDTVTLLYSHEFSTKPPYSGDPLTDTATSRSLVERWTDEVLSGHDRGQLDDLVVPHVLIHPTAMPCEAGFYGIDGTRTWLGDHWSAFPDLAIVDSFTIAEGDIVASRWTARGTSVGEFMGLPPTRAVIEFTGVTMYRIENEQIAEVWDTRNTLGILGTLNPELAGGHHHH
jgi:predicted ester cyclase